MAKHCSKCNQDYADDLAECPHCAAATQTKLGGRGQERPTRLMSRGSERNTQLSAKEPAPEAKSAGGQRDKVEVSDAPPAQEGPSDSMVDLGSLPAETVGSESQVIMAELASNDSHAGLVSDSAVNLAEGEVVAEDEGSSVVNLGASPVVSNEGSSEEKAGRSAVMTDASGIDIDGGPATISASDSSMHPASGSDLDLGEEKSPTGSSSDLDLDPTSGSELDLGGGESAVPGSGIDVAQAPEATDSTSDIDLGAMPSETPSSEPAVSEEEVNDLLAELEETPAQIAARGAAEREAAEIAEGEQAVAAAEAEEAAEAAQAEEEKPAKAAKPRSPVPALAGSAVLGIVIGAGGLLGVQSLMGSGDKPKQLANQSVTQPKPVPMPFEAFAARVDSGDWDEVKAAIDQVPGANPKELVALGKYHLGSYLKNAGAKVNLEDKDLQPALQNLQKAADQKDPDALFDLAFIKELAGKLPEARDGYAKGAQEFANDPQQKQRFEAAISRVEWKMSVKKAGAALIPQLQRGEDRALVLALLSVALQQPPPQQPAQQPAQQPPPAAPAEKPEAGFEFWQAAKLAHEGKFSDAVAAIDKARKLHDERRFSRLRKAQNPLSDPAEDIFLRCCDELRAYWQLENRMREGGYLTDKNTPPEALQALIQKAQGSDATVKELKDKLIAAQKGQQDAEAKAAELQKKLQTASAKNTPADGDLKAKEKMLADRDAALAAAKKENENLKSVMDDMSAALAKVRDELAAAKKAADAVPNKEAGSDVRPQRAETQPLSLPLNQQNGRRMPNPLAAEKHFAAGLNFYFDNDYANAEKELLLAVENDSQDARFFYFLGLSRLARNRSRDAYADFNQGVALERLNRPSSVAVNESLERVQGPTRRLVNGFRENPQR